MIRVKPYEGIIQQSCMQLDRLTLEKHKKLMIKLLKGIVAVVSMLLIFMLVYDYTYSMDTAESFEVNDPSSDDRLLIATQGSEFKDRLVSEVIEGIREQAIYIKVIDVSGLSDINEDDWDAILIIHTWEKWEPQPDAEAFIKRAKNLDDIFTVATSGSGEELIFGVDGISGASDLSSISKTSSEVAMWLKSRF